MVAEAGELAVNPVATGTGLMAKREDLSPGAELLEEFSHRLGCARDLAMRIRLTAESVGGCHSGAFLVDIEADVPATVEHDLPPSLWRCATGFFRTSKA